MIINFTPVFDQLVEKYDKETALVFGRIWRFAQCESGVCYASLKTIGDGVGISIDTVRRRIETLMEADYLKEKEYKIGETRKFTVNKDIMIEFGLFSEGVARSKGGGVARSNTKKQVVKETKKTGGIAQAIIDYSGKANPLEGYPADVIDRLGIFIEEFPHLRVVNKGDWIAQTREYLNQFPLDAIREMCVYCKSEDGWDVVQPRSIANAYNAMKKQDKMPAGANWRFDD